MEIDRVLEEFRMAGTRVSRRDLLRAAGVGGMSAGAVALLAACGGTATPSTSGNSNANASAPTPIPQTSILGGSATPESNAAAASPTASTSAGTPIKGGTWRFAIQSDPVPYPVTLPNALPDLLVCKTMYDGLVKYQLQNGVIQVVPDLADSWTANSTLTEYTFVLKQGVTWHDGQPLTADDVKFTFDTELDPKTNTSSRGNISSIQSVEVVDTHTVKFVLKNPYAPLPVMLGYNRWIVPKHLLQGQDPNQPTSFLKNPVGTGPFKFKQVAQGSYLEVQANPDYFGGAPFLDGIVFKVIPDGNARVAQMKSGDIDFTPVDTSQVSAVSGLPNVTVRQAPQVQYEYIAFNHKDPRFADVRVRQAFAYALDRDAMLKNLLKGYGSVANGPISPLMGDYYNPDVQKYSLDLNKAQQLLSDAGWKKGSDGILANDKGDKLSLRFLGTNIFPLYPLDMVYAQQQFQKLGVDIKLDIESWTVNNQKELAFEWDLLRSYWITPPEPDMYDHYYSKSAANDWAYSNPQVDDILTKARQEPDHQTRVNLYHQFQQIVATDLPLIYLYYPQEVQAVSTITHDLPVMGYRDALSWMNKVWLSKS